MGIKFWYDDYFGFARIFNNGKITTYEFLPCRKACVAKKDELERDNFNIRQCLKNLSDLCKAEHLAQDTFYKLALEKQEEKYRLLEKKYNAMKQEIEWTL